MSVNGRHNMAVAYISSEHPTENVKPVSIFEYVSRYMLSALLDEGLVTKRMLLEAAGASVSVDPITVVIPAGSAIPYNVNMLGLYPQLGVNPTIITCTLDPIDPTNVKRLVEWKDIQLTRTYTDNTRETLDQLYVYGHDNGSQNFNEDTYVIMGVSQGNVTGGGGTSAPDPITDNTSTAYTLSSINAAYPSAQFQQYVLCPNVPAKYLKLDNSPTGNWDTESYNPLT